MTDAAGIVHFANYFHMAEEAELYAMERMGVLGRLIKGEMQMPRVHVKADYMRPLKLWEEYSVRAKLEKVGNSSLHWSFDICCGDALCARLKWVCVRLDAQGVKSDFTREERELFVEI